MKDQWRNVNKVKRVMNMTQGRSRLDSAELPLTAADINRDSNYKGLATSIKLFVLIAFVSLLVFFLIWNFTFFFAQYFSGLSYKDEKIHINHSITKRATKTSEESLSSIKERTRIILINDSIPVRSVESKAVFTFVARRLESVVGEKNELLLWYFENRNKPEFQISNDKLKLPTAKLLYDVNIRNFIVDMATVLDLIIDDSYVQDFNLLLTMDKKDRVEPKTYIQSYIIDRLLMKRYMMKMINDDNDEMWVIDVMMTTVIDNLNRVDIRKMDLDPNVFDNIVEEDADPNYEDSSIYNETPLLVEKVEV